MRIKGHTSFERRERREKTCGSESAKKSRTSGQLTPGVMDSESELADLLLLQDTTAASAGSTAAVYRASYSSEFAYMNKHVCLFLPQVSEGLEVGSTRLPVRTARSVVCSRARGAAWRVRTNCISVHHLLKLVHPVLRMQYSPVWLRRARLRQTAPMSVCRHVCRLVCGHRHMCRTMHRHVHRDACGHMHRRART